MAHNELLACLLYETYCRAVGGKAFNGDPLPRWIVFAADPAKRVQADGWRKVAEKASHVLPRGIAPVQ
jgi:hypothetical protein